MKNKLTLFLLCGLIAPFPGSANDNLSSKVVRIPLNQDQPAVIKLGTQGITTIEFPSPIEALDGYGFNTGATAEGTDQFQISFNKGTNFLSLKAVRPGVAGNLTVVLDSKVYSLFCQQVNDPSFLVIFQEGGGRHIPVSADSTTKPKAASPARLLGFLDKVKGYPTLKVSAPEIFQEMDVAEPNSQSGVEGVEVLLHRVIRDDSLDSVGFEIELINKGAKDFLYDPEALAVRTGNEVYQQSVSDAGGLVPAGKTQTAFFVVTGTANGNRNDLAVTNKFDVIIRQIQNSSDAPRKTVAQWQEPPNGLPGLSSTDSKSTAGEENKSKKPGRTPAKKQNASHDPVPNLKKDGKDDRVAQHNS